MLDKHKSQIKRVESQLRDNYGTSFSIKYLDSTIPCPDCELDKVYNRSENPNCLTCGGDYWIKTFKTRTANGLFYWLTEDIRKQFEIGDFISGDAMIDFDVDEKTYLEKIQKNDLFLEKVDDGTNFTIKTIAQNILGTKVRVICIKRKEE